MRLSGIMGAAALGLLSLQATAQPCTRDFSGEWTREADAAGKPDELYRAEGSGWGNPISIKQDAARFTVEYAFFSRGDMQPPLRFVYAPGEGATVNTVMMGHGVQRQVSTTRWDGCRLVISTRHEIGEVTQTLWLESPARLVVETTRGSAAPNRTSYTRLVSGQT
jgi:hypothetical protein